MNIRRSVFALGLLAFTALTALLTPAPAPALASGVAAISVGGLHTCALTPAGTVKCWGWNAFGQVGDGTFSERRTTPVDVMTAPGGPPLDSIAAVSAGNNHTCALTTAGRVKCWGSNSAGQLGDGTQTDRASPVEVVGLTSAVTAISAGGVHSCALTSPGGVQCWGQNEDGRLGDGTRGDGNPDTQFDHISTTPVNVCQDYDDIAEECSQLLSDIGAISTGSFHTCALTTAGGAKCWGNNIGGQLGDGTGFGSPLDPIIRTTPVGVCRVYDEVAEQCTEALSGVAAITAGKFHTCALAGVGTVKCWGASFDGKLGDGEKCGAESPFVCTTPVDVCANEQCAALLSGVAAVAAAGTHTCAVTTGGAVKCWGLNDDGQLGACAG